MVVLNIHKKSLQIIYKNTLVSKATIFVCITTLIALVFPFIVAYRSRGFWLKHDVYYEQPNIKFRGEYIFVAITTNLNKPIICNNLPSYTNVNEYDVSTEITAREIDTNFDKKIDEFEFGIKLELPETERLLSVILVLPIDYKLHAECPLNMQSAIIFQSAIPKFTTDIGVLANLELMQTVPLFCYSKGIDYRYNFTIIDESEKFNIEDMLIKYFSRNISTYLNQQLITQKLGTKNDFSLSLKVRYPEHKISYKPGFWQVIKWAWIQYFSMYVIIAWVLNIITNYVFSNKLLLFYEMSPIKK